MNDISTRSADFAVRPRVSHVEQREVPTETATTSAPVPATPTPASAIREPGKARPVVQAREAREADDAQAVQDPKKIEQAVARLNDYVQSLQRDIVFSVDHDSGRSVVRVVERGTQEVIRQIPSEVALRLAHNLHLQVGGQASQLGLLRVEA